MMQSLTKMSSQNSANSLPSVSPSQWEAWRQHPLTQRHLSNLRQQLAEVTARHNAVALQIAVEDREVRILSVQQAILSENINKIENYGH